MTRLVTMIVTAAALASTPALGASYSAKPANAGTAGRIIARDINWTCGPDACQGSTEESRPVVLCEGLAKRAGRLESFIADGRAFGSAELGKCNASAKGGTTSGQSGANAN
ncbi:MAG: hypothetical protein ABIN83_04535 [Sphingomicrobium sp.]